MKRFIFLILFFGTLSYAQDPQTNYPSTYYPLLDEYIKEGFERNYRAHTRILRQISYVYFIDANDINEEILYKLPEGSSKSFKVFKHYTPHTKNDIFVITYNPDLKNDYYVLRRAVYKSMGVVHGVPECHSDCTHIMSKRTLLDPDLKLYDEVQEHWRRELNILYKELDKNKPPR